MLVGLLAAGCGCSLSSFRFVRIRHETRGEDKRLLCIILGKRAAAHYHRDDLRPGSRKCSLRERSLNIVVALVGGTGAAGRGLASRFALAGMHVRMGSRDLDKACSAAASIAETTKSKNVSGHTNKDAVAGAGVVVLTIPIAAHARTLQDIRDALEPGAIVVDATVPLEIAIGGRLSRTITLWDGSAAQQAARLLPKARVTAAFHTLSAETLLHLDQPLGCDTLVCGDDPDAKKTTMELAAKIAGLRSVDAGPLENARLLEGLAALLISTNHRYRCKGSGVRITGLPEEGTA
jgi:8-hydroxy-5-deazaflavin:NADPH oxidoreductase